MPAHPHSNRRRQRRLAIESLETRCLMVGDFDMPGLPPGPPPPPTDTDSLHQEESGLWVEHSSFQDEVGELKDDAKVSPYKPPSAVERRRFRQLTRQIISGNVDRALRTARRLDYDVVEFHDSDTGDTYLGFRESRSVASSRGWGSLFVNLNAEGDDLIEVPHPRNDTDTPELGALVFQQSDAIAFLMAGAYRDRGGEDAADVAHLRRSVFQDIHKTLSRRRDVDTIWQLHGFNADKHIEENGFPEDSKAILSNGKATVSPEVVLLDAAFDAHGIPSYAYNEMSIEHPVNIFVNTTSDGTVYDGETFSPLAGRTNVQRKFSERVGDTFIHLELQKDYRTQEDLREVVAGIVSAVVDTDIHVRRRRFFSFDVTIISGDWNTSNRVIETAIDHVLESNSVDALESSGTVGFWVDESGNPIYAFVQGNTDDQSDGRRSSLTILVGETDSYAHLLEIVRWARAVT